MRMLTLGTSIQATVVPSQAVQIGQDKSFVYVARADGTAEMRTVKPGTTTTDSMTVIEEGLKPGEQVITDGQLRLVPGSKITKGQGQPGRGQGGQGQGGDQNQGQGGGERRGNGQAPQK